MGVPGAKLLDDERFTQDFTGITAPTFTTPNVIENVRLQQHIGRGTPAFYFLGPRHAHLLDAVMQGGLRQDPIQPPAGVVLQLHPLPARRGPGDAVRGRPVSVPRRRPPRHFTDDYLEAAMADTLRTHDVAFDFLVQIQTDPHAMPIEDASVVWPVRLSPWIRVARTASPARSSIPRRR